MLLNRKSSMESSWRIFTQIKTKLKKQKISSKSYKLRLKTLNLKPNRVGTKNINNSIS